MLFNSIDFAIFLPIVFILYWLMNRFALRWQNLLIVAASYLFYGWWDWRFLSLIIFSTLVDYSVGRALLHQDNPKKRKALLWLSILVNLGFLGFFKYFNFFQENFIEAFSLFGMPFQGHSLKIILPVGISFYTFQTLSYTIDVYKNKLKPTKDFISFAAFVSFFPQLVAGPIERATNLLPQFYKKRTFDYKEAADGMRQILWGLVKKLIIADNAAEYANIIFNNSADYHGIVLLLGAFLFAFQIYGDFSGYSDIAIGTARLFGFKLKQNFAFPYFSRDIAEFWRRWHISLSTWFRDYLYIPLGGSKGSLSNKIRNVFIIFVVSGFWHGANWTYVAWGALNAIYFIPLMLMNRNRNNLEVAAQNTYLPSIKEFFQISITFLLTLIAWVFFRAENLSHAFTYINQIATDTINVTAFTDFSYFLNKIMGKALLIFILVFVLIEWIGRRNQYAIEMIVKIKGRWIRWAIYALLILFIALFMQTNETPFIYFQF